jgi:hypothetical protein
MVYAKKAALKLLQRGEEEANSMREILLQQKDRIEAALRKVDIGGPILAGLDGEEVRQMRADQNHWRERLGRLDQELVVEPRRIEQHYDVKVWRIEPVGLAYLWPVTG